MRIHIKAMSAIYKKSADLIMPTKKVQHPTQVTCTHCGIFQLTF